MSQSKSKIPSPSRSQGAPITPRQVRTRRTLSAASPARSDASGRLTNVVEQYLKDDKFTVSPMRRRSVLPDDTDIEMPRRASWWKRLEVSSRDVLEALDTNQMQGDLLEEYEFEVPQEKQTVQTLPENSDNDSVASIVVPHRRLFNQKKPPQEKFAEIAGSRRSLGRTLLDDQDQTIKELPKNLFSKGQPRNRPVFPAALLNSTNKTMNKTVEPEPNTQGRNLFGQGGTKRKNMFTDFVLSDSEDDSLVQHKVFGFKNKRVSLASRNRRMPSLTPSVTTDIDIDDWNLLPSSTMIGNGSGAMEESRIIADQEIEQAQAEDQDVTLTEANESLEPEADRLNTSNMSRKSKSLNRTRLSKSKKLDDDFDKTLTSENIEAQPSVNKQIEDIEELHELSKSHPHNKTVVSDSRKNNTMEKETSKQEKGDKDQTLQQDPNDININEQSTENEPSIEDKMAEMHKESEDKSEQEIEASVEQESEKEISHADQDEDMEKPESSKEEDTNEPESSKEISENQEEDTNEPEISKEITNDDPDGTEEAESSKEISNENQNEEIDQDDTKEAERSKEMNNDNQDEEMEPMVWSDNDAEKTSVSNENDALDGEENVENNEQEKNDNRQEVSDHATPVKERANKSQKVVESSAEEDEEEDHEQMEQEDDVVDDTPNSSSDTTGRNRKKPEIEVNSPETVLKNTSKDDMSFKPMGRSTSFRKSKSAIEDINVRPTLIPIRESTIGSEGSRNSSTEGSGWDSHRTTRQTLRQTFGKDFTPRKSLRALVMEQSAKRQMADANTSKANKTKNKTVGDVADHNIRDRRVSNHNLSSDQLPDPKSPVPDSSTHDETDPLISKPQVSHHKSLHDINEPHISHQTISNDKSVNNNQATIDSGPEISIDASYGQGMSREEFEHENNQTTDKTKHHEKSRHEITAKRDTVPTETDQVMQEELDYDPSIQDSVHDASVAEISEHEKSEELSEKQNSENEHSIQELSEHDDEIDEEEREASEQEMEAEESEQEEEQEVEDEESQQNIEPESEEELEHEESQQIEVESEQDEDVEISQQEIESEDEQQQEEVELDSESESENEQSVQNASQESIHDVSQQESEQESDRDISDVPQIELDSDNEENDQTSEGLTERVVFDNEMSDQEIDYEVSDRISRQITEDEVTEHVSDMETDREISVSRFSEQANDLDESIGTKKSLLLMQMQKIAQQNMQIKMKIREEVKNSLKPANNNFMPISKFPIRRVNKPEPKKLKSQPRQTKLAFGALPKEFVEDLKYKPPKRYQPATAPWITKRLYKFLETKLEPKYDYRARVRAEELVQTIHSFTKLVRRRDLAPQNAVDELKKEMARLNVVKTHFEFYEFFHDFMPREVRVKVNPDVVNRIPMPRNGIFGDILQSRTDAA